MMDINWLAVVLAVIAQFVVGAIWYMPLFGKIWGEMHGFDKLSKKQQEAMQSSMGPWYGVQLAFMLVNTVVLAYLIAHVATIDPYHIALLTWLGFTLPAQASAAIFGGAPEGWTWHKIAIQSVGSLASFLVATFIIVSLG